jgi:predicted DNA-binding transcriptional regulator AlpA
MASLGEVIGVETTSERLWTHDETAAYLHISPWTLHHLCATGAGPQRYKIGKHRRYDPIEVRQWLRSRRFAGEAR